MAEKTISYLNRRYQIDFSVDKIFISPLGKMYAEHVLILDHHGDTLIYTRQLQARLHAWEGLFNNKIRLDYVVMDNPYLNLVTYKGESDNNLNIFIKKIEGEPTGESSGFYMGIENIEWHNGRFVIHNYNVKDAAVYEMKDLDAKLPLLEIKGKNLDAGIDQMKFTDKYGINVKQFQGNYFYTPDSMAVEHLYIQTDSSSLKGNLKFYYKRENLKHFFDEVKLDGKLQGKLATFDMNKLAGGIFSKGMFLNMDAQLGGVMNELELNHCRLNVPGTSLDYRGDLLFYELTDLSNFGFDADFNLFIVDYVSLEKFLPAITRKNLPDKLKRLGTSKLSGRFIYLPSSVKSNFKLFSGEGTLQASVRMQKNENNWQYDMNFSTSGWKAGHFFGIKDLKTFAGRGRISGLGLDLNSMQASYDLKAKVLQFKEYPYHHLTASGKIEKGILLIDFRAEDPSLRAQVNGKTALGKASGLWQFQGKISRWDLHKTHWIRQDTLALLSFSGEINLNRAEASDYLGTVKIENLNYQRSSKNYSLKFFELNSQKNGQGKIIDIRSDKAINGYMKGHFNTAYLPLLFQAAFTSVATGRKMDFPRKNEEIRFHLVFDSDLIEILDPDIEVTRNTRLKGYISTADNYIHADLKSRQLIYRGIGFYNTAITMDNQNPIYNFYVKSDSVSTGFYTFSSLQAINISMADAHYLKLKSRGGTSAADEFNLSAKYVLDSLNNLHFRFTDSYMLINHKKWEIEPAETSTFDYFSARDSLKINLLSIRHEKEKMQLSGYDTPENREIYLDIKDLNLKDLLPEWEGFDFAGILNTRIFSGKHKGNAYYNASGSLADFSWNETPLGNVKTELKTVANQTVFLNLESRLNQQKLFSANGYIDTGSKDLDIILRLESFPLSPFNALLKDIFSHIRGTATGHTHISGKFKNPQYDGELHLFGAGLTVKELNTDYQFENNEKMLVRGNKFVFSNNRFFDTAFHTTGNLSGEISFYNFTNWKLDLGIKTPKLLVLNTGASEEALYYGQAFVSGNATIKGFVNKLKIDAAVVSKEGSQIFIPLSDVETLGEDDFIKFYTPRSYEIKKKSKKRKNRVYEGLQLNLDIDITQDAEIEIVLDQEFGSKLKSRGEGTVLLEINTEGNFNMWGSYQVVTGKYNFRYAGIIDKEFDVEPGSTLIWNGDPFRATLDIRATYFIPAADITPLLKETATFNRRVPVKVIINISGDLMKPKIDFEVELPEANPVIRSEVEYTLRDADMRMLQVISLLYSGNFISPDVLRFDNRAALEGNLSERVLSVFNSLLQNDIFNVKLDYIPDRQDPQTNIKTDSRVGLTIQTKINKRIYINGKLAMPVGRYTKSSVSGDVEVDIWLNKNGTMQLKFYNKRTEWDYLNREENYTRGAGISFQVDFDTFKELLKKMKIDIKTE